MAAAMCCWWSRCFWRIPWIVVVLELMRSSLDVRAFWESLSPEETAGPWVFWGVCRYLYHSCSPIAVLILKPDEKKKRKWSILDLYLRVLHCLGFFWSAALLWWETDDVKFPSRPWPKSTKFVQRVAKKAHRKLRKLRKITKFTQTAKFAITVKTMEKIYEIYEK